MSKKMLVVSDSRKGNQGDGFTCFPLDGGNRGAQIGWAFKGDEKMSIPMYWITAEEAVEQILKNSWEASFHEGECQRTAIEELLNSRQDRHGGLVESPDEFPGLREHYPEVYKAFGEGGEA